MIINNNIDNPSSRTEFTTGHSKKNQLKANREYYFEKIKKKKKFSFFIFILILIFIVYLIFYSPAFAITNIKVEKKVDNNLINIQEIEKKVELLLKEKKFFILPQKNLLLLDIKNLTKNLSGDPKIEKVEIEKKGAHTLIIKIKETKPEAKLLILGEQSLQFLDREAKIVSPHFATLNDPLNKLPIIYDKTFSSFNDPVYLDTLKSTIKLTNNPILIRNNIKINSVVMTEENKGIFVIKAFTPEGCAFIFTSLLSFDSQLTNLGVVLKEKIGEKQISQLEYINLGFGEKIFIKFKEKEKKEISAPTPK